MWHVLASSFGITASILAIGGYVLLQWQRNRYRYLLLQSALEKGITDFPDRIPYWLLSLRQGAAILALGIGLLIAGGVGYGLVQGVELPDMSTSQSMAHSPHEEAPLAQSPEKGPPKPPPPPPPSPLLERWHYAQDQREVSLATMGSGLLLVLLGIVRIGFSQAERKYAVPQR
jgi:hypothetical protein